MSYDALKNQYNAELLHVVKIQLDKCKFTTDEWVGYGSVATGTAIASTGLGSITILSLIHI